MKLIVTYFFITLIILQGLFIGLWYTDINFMEILTWMGRGENVEKIKLFFPLIVYGLIKILYWVAEPFSMLFNIILRWVVLIGICYIFYWLFFV